MSYALIFSGQGMQHPAMLAWLAEDDLSRRVQRESGTDWRQRLEDPDWAGRNAHAQLLLTGLGLAAWTQLAPRLPAPAVVAATAWAKSRPSQPRASMTHRRPSSWCCIAPR